MLAVQKEFSDLGLELTIKHNLVFGCYRASWAPAGQAHAIGQTDESHGTVIGA